MMIERRATILLAGVLSAGVLTIATGQAPAPGLRLFGPLLGTSTYLVDTAGAIVHTWPSSYLPGTAAYLLDDGSLLRAIKTEASAGFPPGPGGGVQRVGFDGTLLWEFRYEGPGILSHHDLAVLPNGNVLMIAWETKTAAEAVAAGRDPALLSGTIFRPDHVIEVQPTGPTSGTIVWEWHVWDHLIQDFDPTKANHGVVGNHPELVDINFPPDPLTSDDWNHINSIDYDVANDWILLSAPQQNEIWVIDHGTTTAEAASHSGGRWGHGGDLLYRWGNPQAYRAGTVSDQRLFFQHAPVFIKPGLPGAGNILVFNNRAPGGSEVLELVPPLTPTGAFALAPGGAYGPAAPVWSYSAPGFQSNFVSNAERLPNGNTLICSGAQGSLLEVTSLGQTVWSYTLPGSPSTTFHAHYVERRLWSDRATLSAAAGGTVRFGILCGTPYTSRMHLLAGSASGTTPGLPWGTDTLPLNYDEWTVFSLLNLNTTLFVHTYGSLGLLGDSGSALNVPPGTVSPQLAGLTFHFAAVLADAMTSAPAGTTNAVSLRIVP